MSKAGSSLLRWTVVRAADHARRQDPQLARIYYVQMTERGKDHLGALCVVAANLAKRAWTVMNRQMPYVICDIDGRPVTPTEAKTIIAEDWTVTAETRARRRSKKVGKAPQQVLEARVRSHTGGVDKRADLPHPPSSPHTRHHARITSTNEPLDARSPIGNQLKKWVTLGSRATVPRWRPGCMTSKWSMWSRRS